jgi:hypothetical protein
MTTSFYALGNKNRFVEGGITMVTMRQGEMGVAKFETEEDSFKHRDDSHALKRIIKEINVKFESGKIQKSKYHHQLGLWCGNVDVFAEAWSRELVPFDIRDAYNECMDAIGRCSGTWPNLVPIALGVDFVLSNQHHHITYTHI